MVLMKGQDALVDEVGTLVARYGLDDGHDLLGGVEEERLCVLLLSPAALACAAPTFFAVLFHDSEKFSIFAGENPKVGGFPLPLASNPDSQSDFENPNPKENCGFHKAFGFSFFLLFSRFSDSYQTISRLFYPIPHFFCG